MKKGLLLFILFLSGLYTNGQPLIKIPFGTTPIMDGVVSSHEWFDGHSSSIDVLGGTKNISVIYKHDSINLYIAYLRNLESSSYRFPEILFDINNSKSNNWEGDDWWFHVSATDCEFQGEPDRYDNCQAIRPNWIAIPNINSGAPITDTIEIQIPLATLNIDILTVDTIGISFLAASLAGTSDFWPPSANKGNPSTWANAIFLSKTATSLDEKNKQLSTVSICPNPTVNGLIKINIEGVNEKVNIRLLDVLGKVVVQEECNISQPHYTKQLDLSKLNASVYWLQILSSRGTHTEKVVVQ